MLLEKTAFGVNVELNQLSSNWTIAAQTVADGFGDFVKKMLCERAWQSEFVRQVLKCKTIRLIDDILSTFSKTRLLRVFNRSLNLLLRGMGEIHGQLMFIFRTDEYVKGLFELKGSRAIEGWGKLTKRSFLLWLILLFFHFANLSLYYNLINSYSLPNNQ